MIGISCTASAAVPPVFHDGFICFHLTHDLPTEARSPDATLMMWGPDAGFMGLAHLRGVALALAVTGITQPVITVLLCLPVFTAMAVDVDDLPSC